MGSVGAVIPDKSPGAAKDPIQSGFPSRPAAAFPVEAQR